ncbi:hypothetical protein DUI87_26121 [Hirundo rustica rustica]|uniref:Uncharacterized protein n=1 Tax=Hirundo rustica rustica TaxID=333673 RepID=A0A3M0JEJ3_HIRRU|nr:hypothetical protein DUI87_26121 [Hirundo rustica rustica]
MVVQTGLVFLWESSGNQAEPDALNLRLYPGTTGQGGTSGLLCLAVGLPVLGKEEELQRLCRTDRMGFGPVLAELLGPGQERDSPSVPLSVTPRTIFGASSGIWPRLKRDQRRDGLSLFGPPGQLAKQEQPGTGNEEERRRKKKSKSKSVRIMTDEDVAGPSHPAEETEPEIITRSLSLGELRDLRREFTRQTNESILTWLLRIWDAAANDTILDGSEARQLGSLSRDVVIDQGIGRTQQTLSLWRRLLTSVRDRYLCKEDLQVHQGKWSTMEQGTRCLRELAVLEIIFSEDERFPKSPDDVQCTSQMWLRFARLGPEMYSRYLATLQWREGEDKVGVLVNKLRIYEDTVTAPPFRTHVSSVETRLAEQVRSLIEEGHQKLKKELKEEIYHISPEPTRVSAIRSRYPPARERGYTPRGNLWSFLREHGEDMRNWDGKPTSSLAARVRELKRETPTTKSSSRANTAPVSKAQNPRQYKKNDMTDPLEGTSGTYLQEESNVYHDQE